MSEPLLCVRGLYAGYRKVEVVRDLSLEVARGEVVALLGPNGAGKTTTLLTLAGALPALRGDIEFADHHPRHGGGAHVIARSGLTLVPEGRGLFAQLSVADNLKLARRDRIERSDPVLSFFPALQPLWRRKVALLSGGEQQMLALARALLRRPKLLLIDEMSLGLAPQLVIRLLAVVRQLADRDGVGVLLVEQHAPLALDIADRALVMRHGELVLSGSAEQIRAQSGALESSYLGGPNRGK